MWLSQPVVLDFQITKERPQGAAYSEQVRNAVSDVSSAELFVPGEDGSHMSSVCLIKTKHADRVGRFEPPEFQ